MIVRPVFRTVVFLFFVVVVSQTLGQAQDIRYTAEEYAAYQAAVNEPDPAKREDAMVEYIKARPDSALVEYIIGSYLELLQDYQNRAEMQKVAIAGEKLLAVRPDTVPVQYRLAVAYYQLQQHEKMVPYAEKVFAKEPEPSVAYMLAVAYGRLNNKERQLFYGERACASFEPKDCYQVLTELTRLLYEKKQWDKAADYAKKTLSAFEVITKPAAVSQAEWDEYANKEKAIAYCTLGRRSFESGNMAATLSNYQTALRQYSKAPELNGEAYYYMGRAYWQQNPPKMESAMISFAKGSLQAKSAHAKPCRESLEFLYKSGHNESLAGLDEFIEQATRR